jgi:hypothetical protein
LWDIEVLKAASNKVAKMRKRIRTINIFILFAFDTFDFLATEIVDLLNIEFKGACIVMCCVLRLWM